MKVRLELEGLDELKRTIERMTDEARDAALQFLWMEAQTVLTQAKQLAPLDKGPLRSSGTVDPPTPPRGTVGSLPEIVVGFGGPAAPYALIQHERTDFAHDEGQAKYLEAPFMARVGPDFFTRLGDHVAAALKAAGK